MMSRMRSLLAIQARIAPRANFQAPVGNQQLQTRANSLRLIYPYPQKGQYHLFQIMLKFPYQRIFVGRRERSGNAARLPSKDLSFDDALCPDGKL